MRYAYVGQTSSLGVSSSPSQERKAQGTLNRIPIPETATINTSVINISSNNLRFTN